MSHQMRILVIRRGAIGDVIITLPTFGILREYHPDAYIQVIGNGEYWEIAHKRYYVDAMSAGETKLIPELYSKDGKPSKEITDYFSSFDLILAYINDPKRIVKENLKRIGGKRILVCPPFPKGDDLHAADYTALILREIGLDVNPPLFPKVHLRSEDLDFASQSLSSLIETVETHCNASLQTEFRSSIAYKPLVAIHPRTYGIKGWAIEKFISIGKWIENTLGGKSIWLLGPAEEENLKLIKSNFTSSPLLYMNSLPSVAAILSFTHLYIGCDTGISHLAAAVGAPVLALFGPTNPHVWGPRGKKVVMIKADEMYKIQEDEVMQIILKYNLSQGIEEYKILTELGLETREGSEL